jgi:hypothetical protein
VLAVLYRWVLALAAAARAVMQWQLFRLPQAKLAQPLLVAI